MFDAGDTTAADYCSPHPPPTRSIAIRRVSIEDKEEECEILINRLIEDNMPDAAITSMLRQAIKEDKVLAMVKKDVENSKKSSDAKKSKYGGSFNELTVEDRLSGSACTYHRCFAPMSVLLLKIVLIRPDVRLLFEMSRHGQSTWQYSLFHVLICIRRGEGQLDPVVLSSPHQHTTIHCSAVQCSAVRGPETYKG